MTKHHLTWRPDPTSYAKGRYQVRCDLRPIGFVTSTSSVWEWALKVPGFLVPPWGAGQASSFDEAKAAFLQAWIALYAKLGSSLDEHWQRGGDRYEGQSDRSTSPRVLDDFSAGIYRGHFDDSRTHVQHEVTIDGQRNAILYEHGASAVEPVDGIRRIDESETAHIRHLIGE